jgi:hypothetical protein
VVSEDSCVGYRACQSVKFGTIAPSAFCGDMSCLMCDKGDNEDFCGPYVDSNGNVEGGLSAPSSTPPGGNTTNSTSPPPSPPGGNTTNNTSPPGGGPGPGPGGGPGPGPGRSRRKLALESAISLTVGEGSCNGCFVR